MLYGGHSDLGTVAQLRPNSQSVDDEYEFLRLYPGSNPVFTHLIEWDGYLWGMSLMGDQNYSGLIFNYNPVSGEYNKKFDFEYGDGESPYGSLLLASNGKMYGMTCYGGQDDNGVLFEYAPVTNEYQVVVYFNLSNGANPHGSLIQASNGLLYGVTYSGGTNEVGVLFSYNPESMELIPLYNFDYNGYGPLGSLYEASDGKLYGLTSEGGINNSGVLFVFDINLVSFQIVYSFSDGEKPHGSLIESTDHKLYGLTTYGGPSDYGTLFSYDIANSTFHRLYNFSSQDGRNPFGDLLELSDGKLYGLTQSGGDNYLGVLFEFDPLSSTYTKLFDFKTGAGYYPYGSLMQGSNGKLYGLTRCGGYISTGTFSGDGALFEYDIPLDSVQFKLFFSMPECKKSYGGLVALGNNKVLGLAYSGNKYDKGCVFEYNYASKSVEKSIPFEGFNGANPYGSLVKSQNGKFYGMTSKGGATNNGVIFEYLPENAQINRLINLEGWNGKQPWGGLVEAVNGLLYGLTYSGGQYSKGVILAFDPFTNRCDSVFSFNTEHGVFPKGSLCLGNDGLFYGLTSSGGQGSVGTFFRYNPDNKVFTVIKYLDFITGYSPYSTPYLASNGKIYCTTPLGGLHGKGTIFTYKPESSEFEVIHSFDGANGSSCKSDLMQASDGMLYGTTAYGGANNHGVFFSINPDSNQFTKLADVNESGGYNPMYGALVEIPGNVGVPDTPLLTENLLTVFPNPVVDEYFTLRTHKQAKFVCITNLLGQIVYKQHTKGLTHIISTHSLTNGVYIIHVQYVDGKIDTKKILVVKSRTK
jgi:uncharacterized repeat protein (TIGR03803 family)